MSKLTSLSLRGAGAHLCIAVALLGGAGWAKAARHIETQPAHAPHALKARAVAAVAPRARWARLPLSFEPNRGQSSSPVRFLAHSPDYTVFFTDRAVVLAPLSCPSNTAASSCWVRMKLAATPLKVRGATRVPGVSNYLLGNHRQDWRTGIPHFGRVVYRNVDPGIRLAFYGNPDQLEYDFLVSPHANPGRIRLAFDSLRGALRFRLTSRGSVEGQTPAGRLLLLQPVAYQEDARGKRVRVSSRYALDGDGCVRIELGRYDASRPLVIDPSIVFSTYLGGSGGDSATAVAVDSTGVYVTGGTSSANFPLSPSGTTPYQKTIGGSSDAFISKLNPSGTALIFSTYVGGTKFDKGTAIAIDGKGDVFVAGNTSSTNFPTTSGVFQSTYKGSGNSEVFVLELASSGATLTYSTYLGGSGGDFAAGIALDSAGDAYVAGSTASANFPVANAIQKSLAGASDAFVAKLNASGASLDYSTYLGGSQADAATAIAVDPAGEAIVAGYTFSTDFPVEAPLQPAAGGAGDGFVAKINAAGSALVYSTYFGGSGEDRVLAVATDSAGDAYVAGVTKSPNLLTTSGVLQPAPGGSSTTGDGFVAKLNPSGSQALYSTYLGGSGDDQANGIAVDSAGDAFVTGSTTSPDFHTVNPLQSAIDQGGCAGAGPCASNAFLAVVNPQATGFVYSTYLGGSGPDYGEAVALDASGNAYLAGVTNSSNFPATGGAFQPVYGGQGTSGNGFVTEVSPANAPALSLNPQTINFGTEALGFTSSPQTVALTNVGSEALSITGATASSNFVIQGNTCGSTLAAGGAQCAISVAFSPSSSASTTAATTGTLTVTDSAAGSPQSVALSGTGSTPAPAITFSPSSLTFGNQIVGTTSAAQLITLTNSGTAALTITKVAISGSFTETDDCVTSLDPGKSCTLNVTFAPTVTQTTSSSSTASNTGSLSVTSNVTGTAPTATISGTAIADFSLTATGPSTTPAVGATSATVTVSSASLLSSFTGSITFSCSSNVTCSFNPSSITAGQPTTVTVTDLSGVSGVPNPNPVYITITGTSGSQSATASVYIATQNFGLAASPPLVSINAGQTATYNVTVSSVNGFSQPIALSCSSGLPGSAQCSFSPASVTPGPNTPQTSVLTITTTAHTGTSVVLPLGRVAPPAGPSGALLRDLILLALLAGIGLALIARRRKAAWLVFALVVLAALALASCNLGYYGFIGSNPAPTGSPSGVYTVTIAGTFTPASGSTSQTTAQQATTVNLSVH